MYAIAYTTNTYNHISVSLRVQLSTLTHTHVCLYACNKTTTAPAAATAAATDRQSFLHNTCNYIFECLSVCLPVSPSLRWIRWRPPAAPSQFSNRCLGVGFCCICTFRFSVYVCVYIYIYIYTCMMM